MRKISSEEKRLNHPHRKLGVLHVSNCRYIRARRRLDTRLSNYKDPGTSFFLKKFIGFQQHCLSQCCDFAALNDQVDNI